MREYKHAKEGNLKVLEIYKKHYGLEHVKSIEA